MTRPPGIILLGGGLDSTALLVFLRIADVPLVGFFVDYGQRAHQGEQESVKYFTDKYDVPLVEASAGLDRIAQSPILQNCSTAGTEESANNCLEGRNATLVAMAGTLACSRGAEVIYLGYHREPDPPPFLDATTDAVQGFQGMLDTAYRGTVTVSTPFETMTRLEVLRLAATLDPDILYQTHTCYVLAKGECGECAHCTLKAEMLADLLEGLPPQ